MVNCKSSQTLTIYNIAVLAGKDFKLALYRKILYLNSHQPAFTSIQIFLLKLLSRVVQLLIDLKGLLTMFLINHYQKSQTSIYHNCYLKVKYRYQKSQLLANGNSNSFVIPEVVRPFPNENRFRDGSGAYQEYFLLHEKKVRSNLNNRQKGLFMKESDMTKSK